MPGRGPYYGGPLMTALHPERPPRRGLALNTAIFAFFTALSRVAGLVREIVAAALFGQGAVASAFTIASQIPNLVSNLFAQAALSAAFVPVFTDLLQQGKKREAFRLASTLFPVVLLLGLTGLLVGILQSYDEFTIPAIAPAVWNLVILVLLVALHSHYQ